MATDEELDDLLARTREAASTLEVWRQPVSPEGAAVIAAELARPQAPRNLTLAINGLGDAGLAALAPALPGIVRLKLLSNAIGDASAPMLATACGSHLESLDMWNNRVSSAGAAVLAAALHGASPLRHLSLAHNLVGDNGWVALAAALRVARLSSLDLTQCAATDAGAEALAAALATNRHLNVLQLGANDIGPVGLSAIHAAVSANTRLPLHFLELRPCNCPENLVARLDRLVTARLARHCSLTMVLAGNAAVLYLPPEMWAIVIAFYRQLVRM